MLLAISNDDRFDLIGFFSLRKLVSVIVTVNVNLENVICIISFGRLLVDLWDRMTASTGFPTIRRPTSPKQIISASSVSSAAMNDNLYLRLISD